LQYSRAIPFDVDEPTLRVILQSDLGTGRVRVNRFEPSAQGGYRWLITFMGQPEGASIPLLQVCLLSLAAKDFPVLVDHRVTSGCDSILSPDPAV
jgi:hypothetical protein